MTVEALTFPFKKPMRQHLLIDHETIMYALHINTNASKRWVKSECWMLLARRGEEGNEKESHMSKTQWKQKARKEERRR